MSELIKLYDGAGRTITEFHPNFRERLLEFGYNDTPERRGRAKPISQSGAETWSRQRDRLKSTADAREAAEFDWIGGVIERLTLYVCGKIHCKSNSGNDQIDQAYDNYYHNWCGDERAEDGTTMCDLSGRHRHLKQVQMAYSGFMVDGDHALLEIAPQFSPTGGYCLQSIESDRIGSPNDTTTDENYIGGFSIDKATGRITSARIFRRTQTGQYTDQQEVPMDSMIHVFDPSRPDEYRGRTKLVRCLNDLRDIREWVEAEKIAGKTQSQYAVGLTTKDPFNNNGPSGWSGQTTTGTPTQDALWGKVMKFGEGESMAMLSPSARPSGAFMAFIQTLIRKMSVSLGISYGLLWDIAILGGANTRVEIQSDLRKIEYWQQNIIENIILRRVRNKVIAQGIAMKALPPSPGWRICAFNFGRHLTADLGHEAEADLQLASAGVLEIESVISKHTGKSASEVFASNAAVANAAIGKAAEHGQPVEVFAKGLYPDITAQRAAFLQSQAPPPPPPDPLSIQVLGDKGLKPLVDIMEKVGDGTMDRESAINAVMKIYDISRADASKVIPEEPAEEDLNRAAGLTPEGKHAPVVAGPKTSSSNGSSKSKAVSTSRK